VLIDSLNGSLPNLPFALGAPELITGKTRLVSHFPYPQVKIVKWIGCLHIDELPTFLARRMLLAVN
jgi:hypothetical protein